MEKKIQTKVLYFVQAVLELLASNDSPFLVFSLDGTTGEQGCAWLLRTEHLAIKTLPKMSAILRTVSSKASQPKALTHQILLPSGNTEASYRSQCVVCGFLKCLAATPIPAATPTPMWESIPRGSSYLGDVSEQKLCFPGCHLGLANMQLKSRVGG